MTGKARLLFLAGTAALVLATVGIVWALMSDYNRPAPLMDYVPQDLGMYDTVYSALAQDDCWGCHGTDVGHGDSGCLASGCHSWPDDIAAPPDGNGWHHNTAASAAGNCLVCHESALVGALGLGVSFQDDPPEVVPPTPFSCENCHWEQPVTQGHPWPGDQAIPSGYDTHHFGFLGNVGSQCETCHSLDGVTGNWDPDDPELIRSCERCHTRDTLHAVHQQNYNAWEAVGFHVPGSPPEADPDTFSQFAANEMCIGCHAPVQVIIEKITLRDLDQGIGTTDFSPGTNIRYRVRFSVTGVPTRLYKVVVNGKAVSLYKPDGTNPEWKDKFDNPKRKNRKFSGEGAVSGGTSKKVFWDSQIPTNATPGKKARVRFTLNLRVYDEGTGTWNLLGTYDGKKKFNIVAP